MILFGHNLLAWWVGVAAAPATLLIAAVAVFFCVREWTGLHSMLLNGLDVVQPQVANALITAALTLGLELILVQRLGPIGLAFGGFLGFAAAGAWYFPYLTAKVLRSLEPLSDHAQPRVKQHPS